MVTNSFNKITLEGIEYYLVPVGGFEGKAPDVVAEGKENLSVLNEYQTEKTGIKQAIPKVSDYRERFKTKKVVSKDLIAPVSQKRLPPEDGSLSKFRYNGESLFFGEGLEEDF